MYPNKSSLIARIPLNLKNDDITNIIKDMILRSDSHYTYNAFKKKLGELIIEFYNSIIYLYVDKNDNEYFIKYGASKFHPEKGDFKAIYDIIVELLRNYNNPNFNVRKVTFGKIRQYFIIEIKSKDLENDKSYILVTYSYGPRVNFNLDIIPRVPPLYNRESHIYEFKIHIFSNIDEAKEAVKEWFQESNPSRRSLTINSK